MPATQIAADNQTNDCPAPNQETTANAPEEGQSMYTELINGLANGPSPRILLKKILNPGKLSSYYICLPRAVIPPQRFELAKVPGCPKSLNIVQFKPSRKNFKFIYNHLCKANTAVPSPWCKSPGGRWYLLSWRLPDATYKSLINRILAQSAP